MFSRYNLISNEQIGAIEDLICNRVQDTACRRQLLDELNKMIENLRTSVYLSYNFGDDRSIFRDPLLATNDSAFAFPAPAMQALRNVDAQVPVRTLPYPNNIY